MHLDTLSAIDALHLRIFHHNLFFNLLKSQSVLMQDLRLSESLAAADELPDEFRAHYADLGRQLRPLLDGMVKIMDGVAPGASGDETLKMRCAAKVLPEKFQEITAKVFDRLDVAECDMTHVLNGVGQALQSTPTSMVTWQDCAEFEPFIKFHEVPERRCYTDHFPAEVRIGAPLCADYFAEYNSSWGAKQEWPHYLLAGDLMPLELAPLISDIRFEIVVRGEGLASWRTPKVAHLGELP